MQPWKQQKMGIQLAFLAFVDFSMKAQQVMDLKCTIGSLFHSASFSPFWWKNKPKA